QKVSVKTDTGRNRRFNLSDNGELLLRTTPYFTNLVERTQRGRIQFSQFPLDLSSLRRRRSNRCRRWRRCRRRWRRRCKIMPPKYKKSPGTEVPGDLYLMEWSQGGSNPCPLHCQRNALPAELWPRISHIRYIVSHI